MSLLFFITILKILVLNVVFVFIPISFSARLSHYQVKYQFAADQIDPSFQLELSLSLLEMCDSSLQLEDMNLFSLLYRSSVGLDS